MRTAHRKLLRGVELLGTPLIPPAHADARLKIFWAGVGGRHPPSSSDRRRSIAGETRTRIRMTTKTQAREQVRLAATGGAIRLLCPSRRDDVRRETRRNAGNLEIGFKRLGELLASKAPA